jgi:hypothetical protein
MTGHFTSYETRTDHELATGWFQALVTCGEVGPDSSETESDLLVPLYGYVRVFEIDRILRLQRAVPQADGCDVIQTEKASGKRRFRTPLSSAKLMLRRTSPHHME